MMMMMRRRVSHHSGVCLETCSQHSGWNNSADATKTRSSGVQLVQRSSPNNPCRSQSLISGMLGEPAVSIPSPAE